MKIKYLKICWRVTPYISDTPSITDKSNYLRLNKIVFDISRNKSIGTQFSTSTIDLRKLINSLVDVDRWIEPNRRGSWPLVTVILINYVYEVWLSMLMSHILWDCTLEINVCINLIGLRACNRWHLKWKCQENLHKYMKYSVWVPRTITHLRFQPNLHSFSLQIEQACIICGRTIA